VANIITSASKEHLVRNTDIAIKKQVTFGVYADVLILGHGIDNECAVKGAATLATVMDCPTSISVSVSVCSTA
jgi:hypothetical protein